MSCTIVVGGQYGSEGKGKVVALLAAQRAAPWVVRCGGPNSGHTVEVDGREVPLRQIPAGVAHPQALLLISAGSVIDPELLTSEADSLRLSGDRIIVDPRAALVTAADQAAERQIVDLIGSTASGTGAALVRRILRDAGVNLAGDCAELRRRFRVESVAPLVHNHLAAGGDVIVEGTQGFGLSLLHGTHYPYVTARDTTASGFASEVGLSPRHVDQIVVVFRTFPIRVGGNSGPLKQEITWEDVKRISNAPYVMAEFTTVTKRLRRVAHFDLEMAKAACSYNKPTSLAVMGLDRLDFANTGVRSSSDLSVTARRFLKVLTQETGVPIEWVGTGFRTSEALHMPEFERESYGSAASR